MTPSLKARCAKYVGVPFLAHGATPAGWDCWGELHYIGVHELGKAWPSYEEAYRQLKTYDAASVAAITAQFIGEWRRLEKPVEGCMVGFDKRGDLAARTVASPHIYHVGLVLNAHEMLHVQKNAAGGTVIARFDDFIHGRFCAGFWERM